MAKRRADGGFVPKNQESTDPGLEGTKHHDWGRGYRHGGSVSRGRAAPSTLPTGSTHRNWGKGYAGGGSVKGGSGSGLGRLRNTRIAAKVPDKTEL